MFHVESLGDVGLHCFEIGYPGQELPERPTGAGRHLHDVAETHFGRDGKTVADLLRSPAKSRGIGKDDQSGQPGGGRADEADEERRRQGPMDGPRARRTRRLT